MSLHIFNVFTCNSPRLMKLWTGMVSILVETDQGLVLVDTGPGLEDYANPPRIMKIFKSMFECPLDPQEAAVNQVRRLGYKPEDVRHIVLTHMHFDHCGGLPDFPWAKVHVHRREYEAFTGRRRHWTELAYVPRHIEKVPDWGSYDGSCERWYDFDAIRLPFEPEMWLVPLHGHSRGHCGVAIKLKDGWYFHAGDAGAVYNDKTPAWLIRLVLGPHDARLRTFMRFHPEVTITNSHMVPEWFKKSTME